MHMNTSHSNPHGHSSCRVYTLEPSGRWIEYGNNVIWSSHADYGDLLENLRALREENKKLSEVLIKAYEAIKKGSPEEVLNELDEATSRISEKMWSEMMED